MRISLNLATRPFADLGPAMKRLRIAMTALALIALILVLVLHAFHQKAEETRARDHSLDSQIARITQERQGYQDLMRLPENAQLLQRVGALNQIFDEKAFSWTMAMEDLETVLPSGVQVSTIEPVRAKDGSISVRLRVVGPRDKSVDLVRNLERSKHFLLPRIVGENSESSGGPGEKLEPISISNRVDFDLLADYNPAAPVESIQPAEKPEQKAEKAEKPAAKTSASKPALQASNKLPAAAPAVMPMRTPAQIAKPPLTGQSHPAMPLTKPNLAQNLPSRPNPTPNPNAGGPR